MADKKTRILFSIREIISAYFPTKKQWKNWNLPNKLSSIASYITILVLIVTGASTIYSWVFPSDLTMKNVNLSLEDATNKITNPIQDLDGFLTTNYKPKFDELLQAYGNYRMWHIAVRDINSGKQKIEGASTHMKSVSLKFMNDKLSELNFNILNLQKQVELNYETIKIIMFRVKEQLIKESLAQHINHLEECRKYFHGIGDKDKSIEDANNEIQQAYIKLVETMLNTGNIKQNALK